LDTRFTGFRNGRGARVRLAMAVACATMLASCKADLYTNLDQRQANQIVATLRQHGIPADRSVGKGDRISVSVDESRFAEAVTILTDNGLPKEEFASLGDVFKRDGFVSSPVQERAQMIYALSQELAKTVSEIDGVLSARVHLVLPENDPLRQTLVPSSASVLVRYRANFPIKDLVPQIRQLVANGVAGLSYDKVQVVPVVAVERPPVARNDNETGQPAPGSLSRVRRTSLFLADWPIYGIAGLGMALFTVLALVLLRRKPRVYQLDAADVVNFPDDGRR
jgi:type III secretion protein J